MKSATTRSSATTLLLVMVKPSMDGCGVIKFKSKTPSNVDVYGNQIDMTGSGNGIGLIQQNRGSGAYGPFVTTGNHIHDNVIVSHDGSGFIGGAADFNPAGMFNGGNTWSNNHYYMPDGGHFYWGQHLQLRRFRSLPLVKWHQSHRLILTLSTG